MSTTPTNWWLLHRRDGDEVVAFAEVVVVDDRALLRTGKPMTWGINEELAVAAVAPTLARLQGEGFTITARWHYDPLVLDVERLRTTLLDDARRAFVRLRAARPTLRGFSLQTDDSAMTIAAIADDLPDLDDDERVFSPSEWSVDDGIEHGGADLDTSYRLILSQHRDDLSLVGFDDWRSAFDAVVVGVLLALKDEGVFGADDVVLYDVTDSDPADSFVAALDRLVPAAIAARWRSIVQG